MASETQEQAQSSHVPVPTGREAIDASGLDEGRLTDMLHLLVLCRYFDERMESLYRQGRLPGAIYSGRGQEGPTSGRVWRCGPTTRCSPRTAISRRSSPRASTSSA